MTTTKQNNAKLSRRDFLKIAALLSLSSLYPLNKELPGEHFTVEHAEPTPNIILFVFDALSAENMSLYGYARKTTPQIERFAATANVYHAHYAGGNFTIPGTASLLSGTYPWTNRALHFAGKVATPFVGHNLFSALGPSYYRFAFTQNAWVDLLLIQFSASIDQRLPVSAFSLLNGLTYDRFPLTNIPLSFRGLEEFLFHKFEIMHGAFVFYPINRLLTSLIYDRKLQEVSEIYPQGFPSNHHDTFFILRPVFEGVVQELKSLPQPFIAYVHFFPPHDPYLASKDFIGVFADQWKPLDKKIHPLSEKHPYSVLLLERQKYDEYLAHVDDEFGRLYDALNQSGFTENSYIILTSDHGEIFERGEKNHVTKLLYQPLVHVPLLIQTPGQKQRQDFYSPTSCVDILPTLLHLSHQPIPAWCEGQVLPGFGVPMNEHRSIYTIEAKTNHIRQPLSLYTISMIKENYKLIHYRGYQGYYNEIELFDLENDPEELVDLSKPKRQIALELKAELYQKLEEVNRPYQ